MSLSSERDKKMVLEQFFKPNSIAIIGASRDESKVGQVILKNLIEGGFEGKLYPINPYADFILSLRCYKSVLDISNTVDLAIIAVPSEKTLAVIEACGKKGITHVLVVTAGFREVGNITLEEDLVKLLKKYKMRMIGPNVLGVYNAYAKLDTLFLPRERLRRPEKGFISFVCQSGAIGSAMLDKLAKEGYGFSKFVSYGNNTDVDESDLIAYLGDDEETKVICMYIEGVKDGKKFFDTAKAVARKKPLIVVKGGVTEGSSKSVMSHTGSLAGSFAVYRGIFKQCGIVQAATLEELFDFAMIFEKGWKPNGRRIQIITNGGGYGVLCSDEVVEMGLPLAKLSEKTKKELKQQLPATTTIGNPIDLVGDADTPRYMKTIHACLADDNIDILLVVALFQTPLLESDLVDKIIEINKQRIKPIIMVSTGSDYCERLIMKLQRNDVPCYNYPDEAVKAIKALLEKYNM